MPHISGRGVRPPLGFRGTHPARPLILKFSPHARHRMRSRKITEDEVRQVLSSPELTRPGDPGRTVYERKIGRVICVVVVNDSDPTVIVTVFVR
ncbi:DUF4258 domain-containing protein [Corynebacterium atrinae]|uniref:DUF4258 domain-containing protein n=1 Tax=Corynebacterium atrinae TaxID=1336740 RepID=UPI0025B61FAF|nr:DUF4258 domain-containing protein [Corynebacterium atrinae]